MRGEEFTHYVTPQICRELPPHARRRGELSVTVHLLRGITSACAEKRPRAPVLKRSLWNYLRMRGEECDWAAEYFA